MSVGDFGRILYEFGFDFLICLHGILVYTIARSCTVSIIDRDSKFTYAFIFRSNEAEFDVTVYGGAEQYWFLADQGNLSSKPSQIQILNVITIEEYLSIDGQVESLDQSNNGRLSRARGTDDSCHLAGRYRKVEVL